MKKVLMNLSLWVVFVALATGCAGNEGYKRLSGGPMPQMGSWDGVYFSEAYGRMELSDNGNGTIIGLYEGDRFHGKIEGVAEGDLLNFKWTQWNEDLNGKERESKGHGYFRYMVKEEGTAQKSRLTSFIEGEWGYGEQNSGNTWKAVKFPDNTPKILTMDGKKATEDSAAPPDPFASGGGGSASSSDDSSSSSTGDSSSGGGALDNSGGGLEKDVDGLF